MEPARALEPASPKRLLDRPPVEVPARVLSEVRELYERGLYARAHQRASAVADLRAWQGCEAKILAARMASQLGAPRLSRTLVLQAWRETPADPEACYYRAHDLQHARGPLAALQFLAKVGIPAQASPSRQADLCVAHASARGALRDFDAAEAWFARAERLCPDSPWLWVQRAWVATIEDSHQAALDFAQRALSLRPLFRPGVQMLAELRIRRSLYDEALELLEGAARSLESAALCAQLAALQEELGQPRQAWESLQRALSLSPLLERADFEWFAGRLSEIAYGMGELPRAIELAELAGKRHARLAARMAEDRADRRVKLPVPFVRQNHLTCAPATLTSIARLWSMPADHLEVAEQICYDGTPAHSERRWAEENGWAVRCFTLTWESAVALLDRGVAFTLATVETTSAHLQAVIGYDERRRTLLVRDPSTPWLVEMDADAMLERYAASGPRAMAMVPAARRELLEGLELPEAPLHDLLDGLEAALERHDRETAVRSLRLLEERAPGARVTLQAMRALARYDANPEAALAACEGLLRLFPDHPVPRLDELQLLDALGRKGERRARLTELCARPKADPVFWHVLGTELEADAREHGRARFLLRRYVRKRPSQSHGYVALADLAWAAGAREQALELYRIGACLDSRNEGLARSYFVAARHLRRSEEALEMLRDRFRRFGARSGWPIQTLFNAFESLDRQSDGFAVLERGLTLRPEDGSLLLFAAEAWMRAGDLARAESLLSAARGHARKPDWHRAAAALAGARGEPAVALEHWREVLSLEPLALDAHEAVALRLTETVGAEAAVEHLTQACERFAHHRELGALRVRRLREHDVARAEEALARMVERDPGHAWARRERALLFSATGRSEEASAELARAAELEPNHPSLHSCRAIVLSRAGRRAEARAAWRDSLRAQVDSGLAIDGLLDACASRAEREEALGFVVEELRRQVVFGEGLSAWYECAASVLPEGSVTAVLEEAERERPDLWEAHWAAVRHLRARGRHEEAFARAKTITERFPLAPGSWMELALCARALGDAETERSALESARRLSPRWSRPVVELVALLGREGRSEKARALLERFVAQAPLQMEAHGELALLLWREGEKEAAIDRLERALRLSADYSFAWQQLAEWTADSELRRRAVAFARELVASRAGVAGAWVGLASLLDQPSEAAERLAALDKAALLEPRSEQVHDLRAAALVELGRWDEALAACQPKAWPGSPPLPLRGRRAWIRAARGERSAAIEEMSALVAESPDYFWGHLRLFDWHLEAGHPDRALEAADRLVALRPEDPETHYRRARALEEKGDKDGAREALARVLSLEPGHTGAALSSFDLALEKRDLHLAHQLLEPLPAANPYVAARRVQLAAEEDELEAARLALPAALCVTESAWPSQVAMEAMKRRRWSSALSQALDENLESSEANPRAAHERGVELGERFFFWASWRWLEQLLPRGELGKQALVGWLETVGERQRRFALRCLLWLRREWVEGEPKLWGTVGYALVTQGRFRAALRWLSSWRERAVLPWMLQNLVLAAVTLGKFREGYAVADHALTLLADHSRKSHCLWAAWSAALDDELEKSKALLDEVGSPPEVGSMGGLVQALTLAVHALHHAGPEGARRELLNARRVFPTVSTDPTGRVVYRRTFDWLRKRIGGWRSFIWWLEWWTGLR